MGQQNTEMSLSYSNRTPYEFGDGLCRVNKDDIDLQSNGDKRRDRTFTPFLAEPLRWESTTPAYTRWITDSRYHKLPAYARRWYRPICPNCGPSVVG